MILQMKGSVSRFSLLLLLSVLCILKADPLLLAFIFMHVFCRILKLLTTCAPIVAAIIKAFHASLNVLSGNLLLSSAIRVT